MSTYLLIDGRQQGPFSPDQLQSLLATSEIQGDCLAWRVGLPDWRPLYSLLATWQENQPAPRRQPGSAMGIIAILIGVGGVLGWPVVLGASAFVQAEVMTMLVGLCVLAGVGFNLVGSAFAAIGLFSRGTSKPIPAVALCLNLLPLLGIGFLIVLGLAVGSA